MRVCLRLRKELMTSWRLMVCRVTVLGEHKWLLHDPHILRQLNEKV